MALPDYDENILIEASLLAPKDAIEFFRAKGFKITWDWRETLNDANRAVFHVAKAINLSVLQDIRNEVDKAISKGTTFGDFKKDLEPKLAAKGWTGKKYLTNPKTGVKELVELGTPHRLETIYRTNTQSAYNAGRWESQLRNKDSRPFLQYIAIDDGATRPNHRAQNGTVKSIDSSYWSTWYPPNGYNCRCRVRSLSKEQAEKIDTGAKSNKLPDLGFSGNPGRSVFRPKRKEFDSDLWNEGKKMEPLKK